MDKSIHDYEQSLNDLERQKEQLELVMQQMGDEWGESGPGANWLKTLQSPLLQSDDHPSTEPSVTTTGMGMDETELVGLVSPLTPDTPILPMQTDEKLFHILQQPEPSPEYLQSLLNVNETLLAQSLAAAPIKHGNNIASTATILSPSTDGDPFYVYNPLDIASVSSTNIHTPPITPEVEENGTDTPRLLATDSSPLSSCTGLQMNNPL